MSGPLTVSARPKIHKINFKHLKTSRFFSRISLVLADLAEILWHVFSRIQRFFVTQFSRFRWQPSSNTGKRPARIGWLTASVGRRHPVTVRKASFITRSMRRMWALRHQTGAQYSAVEWTRAKVAVATLLPQQRSPSQQATSRVRRVMSALCEATRCRRYVSVLSNLTPKHLSSE